MKCLRVEDEVLRTLAAFVENHIEALVNALVQITVDEHAPRPIRVRAEKALMALRKIELRPPPPKSGS